MGLIRKSLRAGLFVASPLTAASVGNVKAESKKQRRAKATMENTARIATALEGTAPNRPGGRVNADYGECPWCGEDIRTTALVCLHCQREVTPLDAEGNPDYAVRADQEPSSALKIVEERYARGEITREEFQQIKADLAG